MEPGRADLAAGVALLGCYYGIRWLLRRHPMTRLERYATDARRGGRAARVASVGFVRFALAEGELLERARRGR